MYEVLLLPPAERDLDKLKGKLFRQVIEKIASLEVNLRPQGIKKLRLEGETYRLRVRDIRIIYRIDDREKKVFIYRVKHRKEAYR
ncbi:MAG TPA: type II toxin-antitoxin system RelE/ParE family toxin [bacterium (Candidatus Stahlbacteria)]|nr:type II toxin-antitoxin system RelE/ParE family toxin [Candidatus Stahlbacteria bacterium]